MSGQAGLDPCARRSPQLALWALLTLWALLSPTPSFAAPPVAAALSDVAPTTPRAQATGGRISIGRIFFSPTERLQRHAEKTPATGGASLSTHAAPGHLVVNGAVSSSTQGRAVWVNGAPAVNSASAWTDRTGKVWLRDDEHTPRILRPGQAIDLANGKIVDLLPAGSVVRH